MNKKIQSSIVLFTLAITTAIQPMEIVSKKVALTEEQKQNLELKIETGKTIKQKAIIKTCLTMWLYDKIKNSAKDIKKDPKLGIGVAEFGIYEKIPNQNQNRFLDDYETTIQKILKNESHHAYLSNFEIYSQHGNKGYGPVLWQKATEYVATTYPLVKILTLQAIPLLTRNNALSEEKLYQFYKNRGAQQLVNEDGDASSQFYYDLTQLKKQLEAYHE